MILEKALSNNPTLKTYPDLINLSRDLNAMVVASVFNFQPIKTLEQDFTGTGTDANRLRSRMNEMSMAYQAIVNQL